MTGKKRLLRLAFFALFPLALLAGVLLEKRNERLVLEQYYGATGDRRSAIAAAHDFLQAKGVNPDGWRTYCAAIINDDLYRYLKATPGAASDHLLELAPPVTVSVMLESPDHQHRVLTLVSLRNRVLGFDVHAASLAVAASSGAQEPAQIASQSVAMDHDLASIFGNTRPEVMTLEKRAGVAARRFTWRAPFPDLPDVGMELTVTIHKGQVLSRILRATVDREAAARLNNKAWMIRLFGICYVTFLCLVALYSIYVYVARAIQKEVSHSRTALVALLVSIFFFCVLITGRDDMILQQPDIDRPFPMAFVFALLALLTTGAGVLTGMGYGSGEGDVREAYPGKLTSLDALVTGRLFSANVGRSIVIGSVFAVWLLMLHGLLMNAIGPELSGHSIQSVKFPYMVTPWLSFLAIAPASIMVFAVSGLLQPLAFLQRRSLSTKIRTALLILFATFAWSGTASAYSTFTGFALSTMVSVIGLVAPFFLFDLLTAIIALTGFHFFSSAARITVDLPSWSGFAAAMGSLALVTVGVACVAWWKGRVYAEEEVRPTYARHIAERQEMQAEVSAAREAQLRLLPTAAPAIAGLSICASCLPAKVVGGDFYDFFPLSGERLGIFIAEGGNRGLASALTIALAKGYLMHAAHGGQSPTEVMLRLEATLGSILDEGTNRTTVAYAVVDPRRRTLRYARTGSYPRVVVISAEADASYEREVPVENTQKTVREASLDLKVGDSIYFYTDGIARRIAARSRLPQEDWLRRLAPQNHPDADAAHHHLLKSINAGSAHERHDLEDDLTAIVVRCSRTDELLIEGVA